MIEELATVMSWHKYRREVMVVVDNVKLGRRH